MAPTMFERYGGFVIVRKIVSEFYDRVLVSDRLQRFFVDTDMRLLIDHQTKFIASLMGGPAAYTDDVLRRVHQGLGITPDDFAETAALLRETLEDFDVAPHDVDQVCRAFERRKSCIVTAAAA